MGVILSLVCCCLGEDNRVWLKFAKSQNIFDLLCMRKWVIYYCHECYTIATNAIPLSRMLYYCHECYTIATNAIYHCHECYTIATNAILLPRMLYHCQNLSLIRLTYSKLRLLRTPTNEKFLFGYGTYSIGRPYAEYMASA